jgi:hypothetical protein
MKVEMHFKLYLIEVYLEKTVVEYVTSFNAMSLDYFLWGL